MQFVIAPHPTAMVISRIGEFGMSELQMTREQEAILDEAVKYAQLAEQKARELSHWGDAFAAK